MSFDVVCSTDSSGSGYSMVDSAGVLVTIEMSG